MDALGIEIKGSTWSVVHLKDHIFTVKEVSVEDTFLLTGETFDDKVGELKGYMADKGIDDARISVGLQRESYLSMVIDIPAPKAEAIETMLAFELEKHVPFSPEEVYHGFHILKKEQKVYTILLTIARKEVVDNLQESFLKAGLKLVAIGTRQTSIYNTLHYGKKIPEGRDTILLGFDRGALIFHVVSDLGPIYSKAIPVADVKKEDYILIIDKELRHTGFSARGGYAPAKIDESIIISEDEPGSTFMQDLSSELGLPAHNHGLSELGIPSDAVSAFGLALGAFGKGKVNINLLPEYYALEHRPKYLNTRVLAAAIAFMFLLSGISFLVKDSMALKRYEGAIEEVRAKKDELSKLLEKRDSLSKRIDILQEVDGGLSSAPINILKELTWLLPRDTWLSKFESRGGAVSIEGYSKRASLLLITMGKSRLLTDFEFEGRIDKTSDGKEHFRIKCRLKGKGDDSKGQT